MLWGCRRVRWDQISWEGSCSARDYYQWLFYGLSLLRFWISGFYLDSLWSLYFGLCEHYLCLCLRFPVEPCRLFSFELSCIRKSWILHCKYFFSRNNIRLGRSTRDPHPFSRKKVLVSVNPRKYTNQQKKSQQSPHEPCIILEDSIQLLNKTAQPFPISCQLIRWI